MAVLIHFVYAAIYLVLGFAAATVIPHVWPEVSGLEAWLVGATIVIGGGLVHEVVARMEGHTRSRRRIHRLEERLLDLHGDLQQCLSELDRLNGRLDDAKGPSLDSVMNEMRLLQSLVGQLHERRSPRMGEGPRPPRRIPESGTPVAAPSALAGGGHVAEPRTEASVLEAVHDALRADRIDIYLQPIVSLPQRKHRFYEVYSRVRAADGVQIMPDRYIELAAREGLIPTIDNLLLIRCIQLIRETERRQHAIGFFSNISPATLNDSEFMRQFLQFMDQNRTLVPKLVFELSQADWAAVDAPARERIAPLARMGFRFSMDKVTDLAIDLDKLARAHVRYLKLDRALVSENRPRVAELRQSLEGHSIDLIAEKIETEDQLAEAIDLGIDFGEGFLFGEPRLSRKPA